jgi:hypothetical protein
MPTLGEFVELVAAAAGLGEMPARERRWSHLTLCVIDAVYSVGARYTSTSRTVWSYAEARNLPHVLEPAAAVAAGAFASSEEPITALRDHIDGVGADAFADQIGNRQRTSTRSGILKAQAVHAYVSTLAAHGITRLSDVPELVGTPQRLAPLEADLAVVPGHGSGIRVSYLWMLAGDDHHVKPDRMVLRWLHNALGRMVTASEATGLLATAAVELGVTPWQFDHAIWNHQRRHRTR